MLSYPVHMSIYCYILFVSKNVFHKLLQFPSTLYFASLVQSTSFSFCAQAQSITTCICRGAQSTGASSPRQHFLQWCPISVGPHHIICFMSPFWHLEFKEDAQISENFVHSCINVSLSMDQSFRNQQCQLGSLRMQFRTHIKLWVPSVASLNTAHITSMTTAPFVTPLHFICFVNFLR